MNWQAFLADHLGELVVAGVLLAGSAFCSGTETAMFSLSRGRLMRLGQAGGAGQLLARMMKAPTRLLNTLLLGNMLTHVGYSAMWAVLIIDLDRQGAPAGVTAAASLLPLILLILLGEALPKTRAMTVSEHWALWTSPVVAVLQRVLGPALWLLDRAAIAPMSRLLLPRRQAPADVTADELAAVMELSGRRGVIDRNASALLQEIIELSDLRLDDIMVPRVDMIAYDVDGDRQGLLDLFRRTHLRRVPVYEGSIDRVVGLIHAKRLFLEGEQPLRNLVTPVLFVPEAATVERTLVQLRVRRVQLAVVVDEYGGTAGLVTLKDILEEIVGELRIGRDEEEAPAVQKVSQREYLVDGDLAIHEWADAFTMDLSGRRISTVGGFVTARLRRIPRVGDRLDYRNLRFEVLAMTGRRVHKLRLTLEGQT